MIKKGIPEIHNALKPPAVFYTDFSSLGHLQSYISFKPREPLKPPYKYLQLLFFFGNGAEVTFINVENGMKYYIFLQ